MMKISAFWAVSIAVLRGCVLHKEGSRWIPDRGNDQNVTFRLTFLEAVNQLSELSNILFTNSGAGAGRRGEFG